MKTLTQLAIVLATLSVMSGQVRAQGWPGGSVTGGCAGSPACGCADCRGAMGGGVAGGLLRGGLGHLHAVAGQVHGAAGVHLHPFSTVAEGYHPQALANPPIFGQQVANPYCSYPGVVPGGYVNYGDTCCGPSWYDVAIEAVALTRDGDRDLQLTSNGIVGPIVLGTSDTEFNYQPAMRVTGRLQLNAVANLEATYLGFLDYNQDARATSNNFGLYSIFSNFGQTPLVGVGFRETDQASLHTLEYDSDLDSVEASYRRGWIAPAGRIHGSWLLGARWVRLEDSLRHTTVVDPHLNPFFLTGMPPMPTGQGPGNLDYRIQTDNDLVGMQLGSQVGACVIPGLTVTGEAKFGVYANQVDQRTQVDGNPNPNPGINDNLSATEFAYGSDVRASVIWQVSPLMKLRAGYEALFLSGVATGAGSFSTNLPLTAVQTGMQQAGGQFNLNDDEDIIFHGFHLGLELGW